MWGSWRLNKDCNILTPTLIAISIVSLSFFWCSTRGPEAHSARCGFLYRILSPTGLQIPSGVPRAPSTDWWLSLPDLVSDFSGPQLTDFLSSPSYIIVQSPTQSLEWHVWSSNTLAQAKTLLHSLEWVAAGIGLHVNAHKMEYMCFNQRGFIST